MRCLALVLLFIPTLVAAPPVVVSPDTRPVGAVEEDKRTKPNEEWTEFKARPGQLLRLSLGAETPAMPAAKWTLIDTQGAEIEVVDAGKRCLFAAEVDGRFRILVTVGETIYRVAVIVTSPKPPEPPKPPDELVQRFQDLYTADKAPADSKKSDLAYLVELYTQAVALANDSSVESAGDLLARLRAAAKTLGLNGLEEIRKAVKAELSAAFPQDVQFDGVTRKKAVAVMTRIRDAIKQVKP